MKDARKVKSDNEVLHATEGAVSLITLNRPEKRNALSQNLIRQLKKALKDSQQDEVVRAVLIMGAGPDFCSGADLQSMQRISESSVVENLEDAHSLMDLFLLIRKLQVPVVAAVRGRALAGGCGLATACDIVLASRSARFGYPEVKIGFIPGIVTSLLRRNVSEKHAFELITRGEEISADDACRLGLVNHVFEEPVFEREVERFVHGYERVSRSAVMLSKRLLYHIDGMPFSSAAQAGVDLNAVTRMSEDCRRGVAQFLSRKKGRHGNPGK